MFFEDIDNQYKILEVRLIHMSSRGNGQQKSRLFNTLSYRIVGDSVIRDGTHSSPLQSGDVLLLPKDTPFKLTGKYERVVVIHFESQKPFSNTFEVMRPEDTHEMRELFETAYRTWALRLPGFYYKTMSVFYKILAKLSASEGSSNVTYAYQSILPAIERMQRRFNEPDLQISGLYKLVNLSDTQFRKHFMTIFGMSPIKYLTKLRMEHACELLDGSPMNINEVAHSSGFKDAKHFSTVFKQVYKISPLKYRNR